MGRTEFNTELIANPLWCLSDALSDMNWQQRKILTENCKNSIVKKTQRLRGMYANPCVVPMCPRIICDINFPSVGALPLYEEGMIDKMHLFKVEKSSLLPTAEMPEEIFIQKVESALPAFAYFLKHEYFVSDDLKEDGNVRFGHKTYQHPEIVEMLRDVKRHVLLAEVLFGWKTLYTNETAPSKIWNILSTNLSTAKIFNSLCPTLNVFGIIMHELAEATKDDYCNGVKVAIKRSHKDGRRYFITFDLNFKL